MKKTILSLIAIFSLAFLPALAKDSVKISQKKAKNFIQVSVTNIPPGEQSLFIPVELDSKVVELGSVNLADLSKHNIIAVSSDSKGKAGSGIGILKLDKSGLPETLEFKVFLKEISTGKSPISLRKVSDEENVLPAKGTQFNKKIQAKLESNEPIEVTHKEGSKRLKLTKSSYTVNISRTNAGEETVFIPVIFDKNVVDLEESFGHAIVGPGISAKTYSANSLHKGGAGVEVLISEVAEKDFTLNVSFSPKKLGTSIVKVGFPQKTRTTLVKGPVVQFKPSTVSVAKN